MDGCGIVRLVGNYIERIGVDGKENVLDAMDEIRRATCAGGQTGQTRVYVGLARHRSLEIMIVVRYQG